MAFRNFFLLAKDMVYGDSSAEKLVPQLLYGPFRVPDRPNTIEHNGANRLAADFAQVYFSSQEFSSLTKNYETGYLDPWGRPSRYPPAVHYLCSITICKLDYGYASLLHLSIQILLFYLFFIMAFKLLNVESDLWTGILLITFFLFVTPAGLSFIERGQFSLYVAISYLLLIIGLLKNNTLLIIASALFAYIKWTAFPFLVVIIVIHWLNAKNMKDIISNTQKALVYFLIILTLSLVFRSKFLHFLDGLYLQEINALPEGISITNLLPTHFAKWIPLILMLLGCLYLHKSKLGFTDLIPFFAGAGILMNTYPTIAHEYNIPNLYSFIPLIFYWARQPSRFNITLKLLFLVFIFLGSYTNYFKPTINETVTLIGYLMIAVVFMLTPLIQNKTMMRSMR
jgi:hypothetical protein